MHARSEDYCSCPVCVCVHYNLPPHTLESQKRDTNKFIAIGNHFKKGDFCKNVSLKSYGVICYITSSSFGVLSLFFPRNKLLNEVESDEDDESEDWMQSIDLGGLIHVTNITYMVSKIMHSINLSTKSKLRSKNPEDVQFTIQLTQPWATY